MTKLPLLPSCFVDPLTGYLPRNEVQMSGLLGLYHQSRKTLGRKLKRAEIKAVNVMSSGLPTLRDFHEVSRAAGP